MKKYILIIVAIIIVTQNSCITKDKYKETDIYEEYEAENGFAILHIPPILFKMVLSISEETKDGSVQVLNKVDLIKVLFFEEKNNSITLSDLKTSMNSKIKNLSYNLLTSITEENNDISIYIIENEKIIQEVLIVLISDKEYLSINLVGKLTRDEVLNVYKSINMQKIKNFEN